MQINGHSTSLIPFAEQYVGVWAIQEEYATSLLHQAQQINIQLHLERMSEPEARAAVNAQASTELSVTRDGVAVIQLQGTLTKHAGSMSTTRSMVAARRQVRAAAADPDVIGIMLHIDSPGGTVAGTIDLADDIASAAKQKPVYAYIEDIGASGAYWLASQASKVYANSGARVGSIGVYAVVPDLSAAADKEGIAVNVIRFGAYKGAGEPGTKVTDEQIAEWQKSVDSFGKQFVAAIAAGRGMSKAQVKQLADGRVHDAATALELNLIDGVQTFDSAMAGLVAAGNPQPPSRAKAMSKENENVEPQAATHKELKAELPDASAEFILGQLEANATVPQALKAYNAHLKAENDRLAKEKAEADEKAAKAAAAKPAATVTPPASKPKGNKPMAGTAEASGESTEQVDYYELARDYQKEHKCRWSEACLAIKKRYPESRAVMGAPPRQE